MKILFISGAYPPEKCGVGDYTYQLINTLSQSNLDVHILTGVDWNIFNFFKIVAQIKKIDADIIHIQYPTDNYGYSIVPQLLSLRFKSVVTIHEVSKVHILRRLSLLPFCFTRIIFTNVFERDALRRLFPFLNLNRLYVVPIGSNVKTDDNIIVENKNEKNIIHFGQIRDEKGIESLIQLGQLLKSEGMDFEIVIVGQVLSKYQEYYEKVYLASKGLPITWKTDLSLDEVAKLLAKNLISYFPYPDGASERRGSLLAAMSNSMLVISTKGDQTTSELEENLLIINDNNQVIDFLKKNSGQEIKKIVSSRLSNQKNYLKRLQWPNIATQHESIYQAMFKSLFKK